MATEFEYAQLSAFVYQDGVAPLGWSVVATSVNTSNGFYAEAFSNGSELVIAYRGSTEANDLYNVGVLANGLSAAPGSQLQDARNF